jgi:hypothetical protein
MKSKAKLLAIFTAGLLVGAVAMFLVMGKLNQKQFAEHYAMSLIEQASLGTELRANRQEEVSKRIEANLPSGVLAIHRNKWLQSAPHAQSALRRVKDFYEMNSLPVPEHIAGILNNLPPERR